MVGLAHRSVTSSGGRVSASLGGLQVSAPTGAVKRGETLRVRTTAVGGPGGPSLAGGPFELSTSQGQPRKPVTVAVRYDPGLLAPGDVPVLLHGKKGGKKWVAEQATVDAKRRTITATIDSFSLIDVAGAITWFGGVITGNRRDLPGNCGSPPAWIDGVSFPRDRNDALPSCVSLDTSDQTLKINVVNNRGYAQLVSISGAQVDADRSRWSTSLEGQLASAFTRAASGGGPSEFLLAPGATATLAIQRPQGILGSRVVSLQAVPVPAAAALAPLVWAFLKEANDQIGKAAGVVSIVECMAKALHISVTRNPGAAQTLSAVKRCGLSAGGLSAATDAVKASLKKLAAGLFVTDFFYRLIDLNAQDAYPTRITFTFRGDPTTSPDIRVEGLNLGLIPAGQVSSRRLSAAGGTAPYVFEDSPAAANKGLMPSWVTIQRDGTVTVEPPSGAPATVEFYVVVTDATGQRSPSVRDKVTFRVADVADGARRSPGPVGLVSTSGADPTPSAGWPLDVSADGRFALFGSEADLAPGAGINYDVFLRDNQNATTTLIGAGSGGVRPASNSGGVMTGDGRYVVFYSTGEGLDSLNTSGWFIYDASDGSVRRFAPSYKGVVAEASYLGISADGSTIAFLTNANLTLEDELDQAFGWKSTDPDLYAVDVASGLVTLIDLRNSGLLPGTYRPEVASQTSRFELTADGAEVAFIAHNFDRYQAVIGSTRTGTVNAIGSETTFSTGWAPTVQLSAGGRYAVVTSGGPAAIQRVDRIAGASTEIPLAAEPLAATASTPPPPAISADGRLIAYRVQSYAPTWSPTVIGDVYVYDNEDNVTYKVTRRLDGERSRGSYWGALTFGKSDRSLLFGYTDPAIYDLAYGNLNVGHSVFEVRFGPP